MVSANDACILLLHLCSIFQVVPFLPSAICFRWMVSVCVYFMLLVKLDWTWIIISPPKVEFLHIRDLDWRNRPVITHDALLRCCEWKKPQKPPEKTRGVQVQTFHELVSSMLVNVYLNILFSGRWQRFIQRSSSVSEDDLECGANAFPPPQCSLKKYAAGAKCLIWRWALSV